MEDPRNISTCTQLLFCAKNIERIGDHATNIAEAVYYMVKGEKLDNYRPKEDKTLPRYRWNSAADLLRRPKSWAQSPQRDGC